MSDSHRRKRPTPLEAFLCILALLGLCALIYATGRTFGVEAGRDQVSAREHYETAKQDALDACGGRQGSGAIECVTKGIESAQGQSESRQDLYAQQDMARWAFWMLVVTAFTFGATAIGVWLVKRTLDATLDAVKDTGDATVAMQEANDIARHNARAARIENGRIRQAESEAAKERRAGEKRQLRAYVDFESVSNVIDHRRDAKRGYAWRGVKTTLRNYGQTPADNLEISTTFFTRRLDKVDNLGEESKQGLGAIMPGATFDWSDFLEFGEDLWEEIGNQRAEFIATIVIKYVDAFGEPRMLSSTYSVASWNTEMGFLPGTRFQS